MTSEGRVDKDFDKFDDIDLISNEDENKENGASAEQSCVSPTNPSEAFVNNQNLESNEEQKKESEKSSSLPSIPDAVVSSIFDSLTEASRGKNLDVTQQSYNASLSPSERTPAEQKNEPIFQQPSNVPIASSEDIISGQKELSQTSIDEGCYLYLFCCIIPLPHLSDRECYKEYDDDCCTCDNPKANELCGICCTECRCFGGELGDCCFVCSPCFGNCGECCAVGAACCPSS